MKFFNAANLAESLQIMWKGMLGIFVVMLIIYVVILVLSKVTKN